jgi:hypothetical protein
MLKHRDRRAAKTCLAWQRLLVERHRAAVGHTPLERQRSEEIVSQGRTLL